MAQTYTVSGQIVLSNNNLRNIVTLSENVTTSGSNSLTNTANIPTGSWTPIDQGSNSDFRFGYFTNLDATSSIWLALNNTSSFASFLQPGDLSIITNSGTASLYAKATGSNSPALLQYILIEK